MWKNINIMSTTLKPILNWTCNDSIKITKPNLNVQHLKPIIQCFLSLTSSQIQRDPSVPFDVAWGHLHCAPSPVCGFSCGFQASCYAPNKWKASRVEEKLNLDHEWKKHVLYRSLSLILRCSGFMSLHSPLRYSTPEALFSPHSLFSKNWNVL